VIVNYRKLVAGAILANDWYWYLPVYKSLRAHPGFADLLDGLGLPAYWDQAGWPEFCRREAGGIVCR
jgi:hypothetical protein